MKASTLLLAAALAGGMAVPAAHAFNAETARPADLVACTAPVPSRVVAPTGLWRRHEGETVKVALTIDATGQPAEIRVIAGDRNLQERLVPAVAQWKFEPARRNGEAVTTRVVMPIRLVSR